jgi:hypothetical protein
VTSPTNTFDNAYGIAVSSDASLVSVAVRGYYRENGGLVVLDANSGVIVTNLDSGDASSYIDTAWDNAGNVYGTREEVWRVFSPPGPNQSTTATPVNIQVLKALTQPRLTSPQWSDPRIQFTLNGQPNVSYLIDASVDLSTWTTLATNYSTSAQRTLQLTTSPDNPGTFFRARALTPAP